MYCMYIYSYNKIFWDHDILVKKIKSAGDDWQLFFKNSGGERVIHSLLIKTFTNIIKIKLALM